MTKVEATLLAHEYLKQQESHGSPELVLLESATLERSFGWVFFYDSRKHFETGDFHQALAGNAPFVVTRSDGRIVVTGTAYPVEKYLSQLERGEMPSND